MGLLKLFSSQILDKYVRQNFDYIAEYVRGDCFRKGNFAFREYTFGGTGYPKTTTVAHNLGFIPKDLIQLSATGGATLVWDYDSFDRTNLKVTVSAATTARVYVGRYEES